MIFNFSVYLNLIAKNYGLELYNISRPLYEREIVRN